MLSLFNNQLDLYRDASEKLQQFNSWAYDIHIGPCSGILHIPRGFTDQEIEKLRQEFIEIYGQASKRSITIINYE